MTPRRTGLLIAPVLALIVSCASPGPPRAASSPTPLTTSSPGPAALLPGGPDDPLLPPDPPWPSRSRDSAPPALGAVETLRVARVVGSGRTLAAGLILPRIGGTGAEPVVMTPCGRSVRLSAEDVREISAGGGGALPKPAVDVTVVLDPGHGGRVSPGAVSPRGDREADRVLAIALEARRALAGRVGRVFLTRTRDQQTALAFRVALADALRADAAVSIHLNARPDGPRSTPGLETYASVADPQGRRFAGVMYEAERRYLDTLGGPWVGDRDAGAKYRLGQSGDFFRVLRASHVPWVLSESLFISAAREAGLVARPEVRAGLARAIADGIVAFTQTSDPGAGWVEPRPTTEGNRAPEPGGCVDPAR